MNERALDHRRLLLNKVATQDRDYDPQVRMLRRPFHSPGYHTALTAAQHPFVHPTYPTLLYALALLNTEAPDDVQRACAIVEQVLTLQDRDPERDTYGIWPWFYEESLAQMSPPDWNWADFCGKELVAAALLHGNRLPARLYEQIREAVSCACDAIMIRDVGPHYTNIAIMGAFVTLIAGELYDRQDFLDYAMRRLEKLQRYTDRLGTYQEYNSPNYSIIAIVELSKIRAYSVTPAAREMAAGLLDMVWRMAAEHYHPATGQWAGPHSRSYQTLLSGKIKSFLQLATGNKLAFFTEDELEYDPEWYGIGCRCPDAYLDLFIKTGVRELEQPYYRNEETGLVKLAQTYMTSAYTIGLFKEEIMWNQTRGLVGYFDNGGQAAYMQMRCLHDGYDYCSAVLCVAAEHGQLLLGVRFLTNGGDTHPNLDPTQGSIDASDFRLRMEFGGCLDRVGVHMTGANARVDIGGLFLRFECLYAAFGTSAADVGTRGDWVWELNEQDGRYGLDLVIHTGERKAIDFRSLDRAAIICSLIIGGQEEPRLPIRLNEEDGYINAAMGSELSCDSSSRLRIPLKPSGKKPE